MSPNPASASAARIVRILLLLLGALVVAYAISDHPFYGGEPGFGSTQMLIGAVGIGIALCALLPTRIAGSILLLVVTILTMLAFMEMAGEIMLRSRFRPNYQYDDRLIFKFIPSRDGVMTRAPLNGGETAAYRINSDGFRGPELLPAGKATRLAVYGDSFIHAFYSNQEETFAAQLGTLLEKRLGKQVEVVNAGVSSYGPDQVSLKMEDELPGLRPDLVIVAIFAGNDYGDLLRNKMFLLDTDGALVENRWKLDSRVRTLFDLNQRESILKRALRSISGSMQPADRSRFSNLDFLLGEAEREYRSHVVEHNDIITNTHTDYYSADVSLTPKSESARYKVALMGAVMRRMRDIAGQNGVPLAFLFIPHPVDVADHYDAWQIDRKRFPDYDGRNQIAPLEDTARSLNVPFVSLYDAYRRIDANALYFHDDDHWNAAGQRLAAEVMADYLLAHNLPGSGMAADATQRSGVNAPHPNSIPLPAPLPAAR
ncbi:MAG: SGNH/GDSL hydrolase family protein [Nitrosomonadales bacterium]|nr:SGNH/GDSL hydrolase family protein [Nitrosomonadales bacterium]